MLLNTKNFHHCINRHTHMCSALWSRPEVKFDTLVFQNKIIFSLKSSLVDFLKLQFVGEQYCSSLSNVKNKIVENSLRDKWINLRCCCFCLAPNKNSKNPITRNGRAKLVRVVLCCYRPVAPRWWIPTRAAGHARGSCGTPCSAGTAPWTSRAATRCRPWPAQWAASGTREWRRVCAVARTARWSARRCETSRRRCAPCRAGRAGAPWCASRRGRCARRTYASNWAIWQIR